MSQKISQASFKNFLNKQSKMLNVNDSADYVASLHLYWNGQFEKSIAKVSEILAAEPDHEQTLPLYRLWIENLTRLNRHSDLQMLQDHFFERGMETPELKQSYMALRGLTHLSMEQDDAVNLLAMALTNSTENSYALEFQQAAGGFKEEILFAYTQCETPFFDYFHFASMARAAESYGPREFLEATLDLSQKVFPGNPLKDEYSMHHCFESKYYPGALQASQNLYQNFSANLDYKFFAAFSMLQCRDFQGVIQFIENGQTYQGGDPDFLNVLGRAYAELGRANDSDELVRKAEKYLEKASVLARPFMLSAFPTDRILNEIRSQFLTVEESAEEMIASGGMRHWLVKLDPSLYHEIATKSVTDIEQLSRPMGASPRPGDLCFMVADAGYQPKYQAMDDDERSGRWVVAALYEVKSNPSYDPIYGNVTGLELIERISDRVNVDVKMMDEISEIAKLPRNHPGRFGVFEIDDAGLSIITDAVRRRNLGVDHVKERRGNQFSQKKLS